MKNLNRKRKGFTLIELIVVVAIIGILAIIAIPRFATATVQANVKAFQSNHNILVAAVSLYAAAQDGDVSALDTSANAFAAGGPLAPYVNAADLAAFAAGTKGPESGTNAATYAIGDGAVAGDGIITSYYATAATNDPSGNPFIPMLGDATQDGELVFIP